MKSHSTFSQPTMGMLLAATVVAASAVNGAEPAEPSKNRIGIAYTAGWQMRANFLNLGSRPSPDTPGRTVGGMTYSDGFVGFDDTENALDLTSHWGFNDSQQVQGDELLLRRSDRGGLAHDVHDEPYHGVELSFGRELGGGDHVRWGLQAMFGYTDVQFGESAAVRPGVVTVDAYPLNGITPPVAPPAYEGPPTARPGAPLLGTDARTLPVSVTAAFDAHLYSFRLGPYLEIPVSSRLSFLLGAGFSLAIFDASFSGQESSPLVGGGSYTRRWSDSQVDALPGGYVGVDVSFEVCPRARVFAGLDLRLHEDLRQETRDKAVEIDMSRSLFVRAGVSVGF